MVNSFACSELGSARARELGGLVDKDFNIGLRTLFSCFLMFLEAFFSGLVRSDQPFIYFLLLVQSM